jgi:hypothetical protein
MNIYWFTLIFIAWYALSLIISERYGKDSRIGVEWLFFISMMLSPLAGMLALLISKDKER